MKPASWVRDDRGSLFLTSIMWFMIALLLIPSSYLSGNMDTTGLSAMGQANALARTIKLALLGLSAFIVFRRRALAWLVLRSLNRFFVLFLVLVPVSLLWSIDPAATIARYVSLLSIVLVCFAFVLMSWHPRRFQETLRPVLIVVLVASIIFGIISPQYAIEQGEGTLNNAWRGLTSQKNEFGMLGSFAFILWMHACSRSNRNGGWHSAAAACPLPAYCCRAAPPRCCRRCSRPG